MAAAGPASLADALGQPWDSPLLASAFSIDSMVVGTTLYRSVLQQTAEQQYKQAEPRGLEADKARVMQQQRRAVEDKAAAAKQQPEAVRAAVAEGGRANEEWQSERGLGVEQASSAVRPPLEQLAQGGSSNSYAHAHAGIGKKRKASPSCGEDELGHDL